MTYILQLDKEDTLNASGLAAGATSGTLTTGAFGSPAGKQLLEVDYDVDAKKEVISATIAGTALTGITRALDGTSDVDHSANAKIGMAFVPSHYGDLGKIAALDTWTAWTPTYTGLNAGATVSGKYIVIGKTAYVNFSISGTGSTTAFTITNWPVTPKDTQDWAIANATDNGTNLTTPARLRLTASSTTATLYKDCSGAAWIAANARVAAGNVVHEIA